MVVRSKRATFGDNGPPLAAKVCLKDASVYDVHKIFGLFTPPLSLSPTSIPFVHKCGVPFDPPTPNHFADADVLFGSP